MNEVRRQLMHRVIGDAPPFAISPALYHLDRLTLCEPILVYLIQQRMTGNRFLNFIRDHGGYLAAFSELARRVQRNREREPFIAGKNFRR